jgi:hypothetical protein
VTRTPEGPCRLRLALMGDSHIEPDDDPLPRSNQRAAGIVARINTEPFDAVIHLGDVVHPLPSMPSAAAAWRAAEAILQELRAPLHVVPGNHDIGDKSLDWLPAKAVRTEWAAAFARRFGSACRVVDKGPLRLLLLNAPLFNSGLALETEQWQALETLLGKGGERRLFAFLHYPPFLVQADEPSHYDNLDEPARGRLLDLLSRSGCEALFCGHVHHRFLSRHAGMDIHTVPATAFTRRDYVETHPLAPTPAQEFGRNLTTKLGYLELEINERGYRTRFRRLDGDFATKTGHELGVDLRYAWCEVRALPFNPPTDAFQRRRVRDDRAALALLDLGIRRARVPVEDLLDPLTRERMALLADHGIRWTVFALAPLPALAVRLLREHAWMVEAVEAIGESNVEALDLPVMAAPLVTSHDIVAGTSNLTQFTGWGLSLEALRNLPPALPEGMAGYVLYLPWQAPLRATTDAAAALASSRHWRLHVTVGLMAERPDLAILDDAAIAGRVEEAAKLARHHPDIAFFLDTFEDIDRGYFVRRGLIDRRGDPTPAGLALVTATKAHQP